MNNLQVVLNLYITYSQVSNMQSAGAVSDLLGT